MREIKFRGWNGALMDYDPSVWGSHENGECWVNKAIKCAREDGLIFMQFTGLFDKFGKEIFEGDVVKAPIDVGPAGEVIQVYAVVKEDFGWNLYEYQFSPYIRVEVVGNIYENPELLEDKT